MGRSLALDEAVSLLGGSSSLELAPVVTAGDGSVPVTEMAKSVAAVDPLLETLAVCFLMLADVIQSHLVTDTCTFG